MSAPKTTETNIGVMAFVIFVLFLLVPFLNIEITYYYMSLKLFGFALAVAVLACYLLWEWGRGRLRASGLPAYWLFAPPAMWVLWGLLTTLWSYNGWLAAGWVVQGGWGLAGAFGLAILLRERGTRQVFVAASSAVALVLAVFMVMLYGEAHQTFFGDVDLVGRGVAAAFLLVPTVVAAAMLYALGAEEDESAFKVIIWLTALLLVMLVAGFRTLGSGWTHEAWLLALWPREAWLLAVGTGLAIVVWLMLPRLRLGVVALVVFMVVVATRVEVRVAGAAEDFLTNKPMAYYGLMDATDRQLFRSGTVPQMLFGRGVGTYILDLDRSRGPATYATPRGNIAESHARRYVSEVATERGVVGLLLGIAMGAACLVAGAMAFRRAQTRFDAALGAGLAGGVAAMGVFGCYSSGPAGFGANMAFWMALGLLGALSVGTRRAAATSYSAEEEAAGRERGRAVPAWRGVVAVGGGVAAAALWFALALRPFLADWYLKEGVSEYQHSTSPGADAEFLRRAEDYLGKACSLGMGDRVWLQSQVTQAQWALDLADRASVQRRITVGQYDFAQRKLSDAEHYLERCEDVCDRVLALDFSLGRCYAVALNSQIARVLFEKATTAGATVLQRITLDQHDLAEKKYSEAAKRLEELEDLCGGPFFDLDVLLGRCYVELGQPKVASEKFFARYLHKDPFAISSALNPKRENGYGFWFKLIYDEREKQNPGWVSWAKSLTKIATAGLKTDPSRYPLLMCRGRLAEFLGSRENMLRDMADAAKLIKKELDRQERYPPVIRGRLIVEYAEALGFVNTTKALEAIKGISGLGLSTDDPTSASVLYDATRVRMYLEGLTDGEGPGKKTAPVTRPDGDPTWRPKARTSQDSSVAPH